MVALQGRREEEEGSSHNLKRATPELCPPTVCLTQTGFSLYLRQMEVETYSSDTHQSWMRGIPLV